MKRASFFLLAGLLAFNWQTQAEEVVASQEITVYRSPSCGCCGKWLEHVKQHHFNVKDVVTDDMPGIKAKLGVPSELASCHTAIVDGYVIEGHVPASDIQRLLKTRPAVVGIAAPGMPMGSPGMEMGGKKDAYPVISFDKQGKQEVFEQHGAEQ